MHCDKKFAKYVLSQAILILSEYLNFNIKNSRYVTYTALMPILLAFLIPN